MNDRQIAALKPTKTRQEISLPNRGLYLLVQPSGAKSFQARYRIDGKLTRKKLGDYPAMSLRQANAAADKLRAEVEEARQKGEAPVAMKPAPKPSAAKGITFTRAWGLYMEHEGNSRASSKERWRVFKKDFEPTLGAMALADVDRDTIEELLMNKAHKAPVASNTMFTLLQRFFNWSTRQGHSLTKLDHTPMANVAKVGSDGKRHDRFLSEQELKWFFKCVDEAGVFENGFIAALYTGQRLNQIFGATRERLEGDILTVYLKDPKQDSEVKTTPVWLHPDVMKLIPEATKDTKPTDTLFAGRCDDKNKALARVEEAMKELSEMEGKTLPHFSPRSLRKTMSNWMGNQFDEDDELLIDPFTIARCLSHVEKSIRAKHYSQNVYLPSKKKAWRLWGDYLSELRAKAK